MVGADAVPGTTMKLRATGVAAVMPAVPGCSASTVQVPVLSRRTLAGASAWHTNGVWLLYCTGSPLLAVAVSDNRVPTGCGAGNGKVMAWLACGVTVLLGSESTLTSVPLSARTRNCTGTPLASPVTGIGEALPVACAPPLEITT